MLSLASGPLKSWENSIEGSESGAHCRRVNTLGTAGFSILYANLNYQGRVWDVRIPPDLQCHYLIHIQS